jgi:signal transduction histidine kinase
MKWRGPMVDATAATVATVVTLAILSEGGLGSPDPTSRVLDEAGLLLALATGLPLAFSRRSPVLVFAVSALASIFLMYFGYPLDVPLGPVYAGYVLVLAWGGAGSVRRGVAAACVVGYVPVVAGTLGLAGVDVWAVTTELSTWGMAMVGVWLAAERTRLRQGELAAAEERARRTEREAERENRLAAAEERTRIARELHDSAGHAINVILVQAGAARLLHERDPSASLRAISTVEDVARATIVDIDRMVHALRSAHGEPVPADPAALEELLDHHRRSGLRLATRFDGERRPLPRSVAWAAYRILQEALTNAARHGAGSADVVVGYGTHAMEIAVTNRIAGAITSVAATGAASAPANSTASPTATDTAVSTAAGHAASTAAGHAASTAAGHAASAAAGHAVSAAAGTTVSSAVGTPVAASDRMASPIAGQPVRANGRSASVAADAGNGNGRSIADGSAAGPGPDVAPAVDGHPAGGGYRAGAGGISVIRPNGGHGLIGMRERAILLGGTFSAGAETDVFHVRVHLPYDAERHSAEPHHVERHNIERHNIERHSAEPHHVERHNTERHNTERHNTERHNTERHDDERVA